MRRLPLIFARAPRNLFVQWTTAFCGPKTNASSNPSTRCRSFGSSRTLLLSRAGARGFAPGSASTITMTWLQSNPTTATTAATCAPRAPPRLPTRSRGDSDTLDSSAQQVPCFAVPLRLRAARRRALRKAIKRRSGGRSVLVRCPSVAADDCVVGGQLLLQRE